MATHITPDPGQPSIKHRDTKPGEGRHSTPLRATWRLHMRIEDASRVYGRQAL